MLGVHVERLLVHRGVILDLIYRRLWLPRLLGRLGLLLRGSLGKMMLEEQMRGMGDWRGSRRGARGGVTGRMGVLMGMLMRVLVRVRMLVLVLVRVGVGVLELVLVLVGVLLGGLGVVLLLVVEAVEGVVLCVEGCVRAGEDWKGKTYGSRDKGWD